MPFLDTFPKIYYDIEQAKYPSYELITDVFFRVNFLKNVLNNIGSYYYYTITDSDKPEILAEKIYGNPEAYWIILYANDIYDPQYDWPLDARTFQNYVTNKYGSIANSQITMHHYEKVIRREESLTGIITEKRIVIDYDKQTDDDPTDVPYDYYLNLPEEQSVESIDMDGQTVVEIISREAISNFDYEVAENERKRIIRVIKSEYYSQIMDEFDNLTKNRQRQFTRGLP